MHGSRRVPYLAALTQCGRYGLGDGARPPPECIVIALRDGWCAWCVSGRGPGGVDRGRSRFELDRRPLGQRQAIAGGRTSVRQTVVEAVDYRMRPIMERVTETAQ